MPASIRSEDGCGERSACPSRRFRGGTGGVSRSRPLRPRRQRGEGISPRPPGSAAHRHVRHRNHTGATRPDRGRGRPDPRVALEGAAALPAADEEGRGADRGGLPRRDQHAAGEAGAVRAVRGGGEQGRGQPGLAQGQDRLGRVVRPRPRRGGHRAADPGRHGSEGADRPEGDLDLGARGLGVRRDGQKILLSIRNMGGESKAAWRAFLDDLDARGLKAPEFVIVDGAPGLEGRWPSCGRMRRFSAARFTSTATCSPMRRSRCTTS